MGQSIDKQFLKHNLGNRPSGLRIHPTLRRLFRQDPTKKGHRPFTQE
jgi:hypothetical protein